MKDREFSTKELGESIKALVKAAPVNHESLIEGLTMSESYYYKVVNGEQTI